MDSILLDRMLLCCGFCVNRWRRLCLFDYIVWNKSHSVMGPELIYLVYLLPVQCAIGFSIRQEASVLDITDQACGLFSPYEVIWILVLCYFRSLFLLWLVLVMNQYCSQLFNLVFIGKFELSLIIVPDFCMSIKSWSLSSMITWILLLFWVHVLKEMRK